MPAKFRLSIIASIALSVCIGSAAEPSREELEFFEKKIRPVLADNCYKCHSAKSEKVKGALLLDSRAASLKGGEHGPAVVPGDLEKSLIVKAVRYKDEKLQMPPDEPLSDAQIADIEHWIRIGAPDPRTETTSLAPDPAKAKQFWSFKKPTLPAIPVLKKDEPNLSNIDKLVRAKLEAKGIPASPQADKLTLIRRATFDLIGLPPTPEEIDAFQADTSPDAFAKVIDRLLASPRYGERWARYWLDVARYADTKGYVFEEERRYPYSYVYRDWVIRAINEDVPYDQFLIRQIAADKLPPSKDNRDLAAMGFLLLGRRFLNNQADIIDDRLDVLMRGTQALTIGCARCHDHKFDAITQKDYYGLYGVFASSNEPKELPLLGNAEVTPTTQQYEKEVKAKEAELESVRHKIFDEKLAALRGAKSIADYLATIHELGDNPGDKVGKRGELNIFMYNRWKAYLKTNAKAGDAIWGPWVALAALKEADFAAKAPELIKTFAANADKKLNPLVAKMFEGFAAKNLHEVADKYGALLAANAKPDAQKDADAEKLRLVTFAAGAPALPSFSDLAQLMNRADGNKERDVRKKIDALAVTHPGAPPRAMVLNDNSAPVDQHVFLRGDPGRPGEKAPREFIGLLSGPNCTPFKNGSGRLELAQSIASADNPLTARVMVNRVWMHHFGTAIVRTPSDFGVRSDPPANQELLDYLAVKFVENGWSLKKLHREIMLSKTYQQSSDDNADARKLDSENALYWRFNRQRLDFEAMRDSLLATSGQLDAAMGGRAVELTAQPFPKRRSIYGYIDRQNLPGMFRAFDFASPDTHSPQRFNTTVPQQALYMMNSPFVLDQAKQLAARKEIAGENDSGAKIQKLYRVVFGRAASADEIKLGQKYIALAQSEKDAPPVANSPWQFGYGYFDEAKKRTGAFTPLPHFTGNAWQGGGALPDPKIGWVLLTKEGGHPGDAKHAAIRRWTAPRDGTFAVCGRLNHPGKVGDGVRARIVSSAEGEKGIWTVFGAATDTKSDGIKLKKGDTLDFVVDCRENENTDSFEWTVTIKILDYGASFSDEHGAIEWSSANGFSGTPSKPAAPLAPWEKYAQVLLLSNEFVFVD
ncbi:MAG TPA: PSD1 and planctomycete cytochrome C domain-containing protein [Planctomycetota bacterium]|nr:PSD1 and planctomycete cytochrome C domain-containing protein [Planctomycetota bacterium]